jgi:hypothetical protein
MRGGTVGPATGGAPAAAGSRFLARWIAAGMLLACPAAGIASLGSKVATVEADRVHLSAARSSRAAGVAMVHTLTAPNGGTVNEFASADGTIFAVNWRGPARPDLQQILGDHFSMMGPMHRAGQRRMQRVVAQQRPNLVILSQGHPGAFFGVAYDPALVPAGFSLDALR